MVNHHDNNDDALPKWKNTVISILEGENSTKKSTKADSNDENGTEQEQRLKVKKLRKLVLLSLQLDEDDKSAKKSFKHTIQTLEMDGTIHLDEEGHITLKKKKKRKQQKEENKKSKKEKTSAATNDDTGAHQNNNDTDNAQPQHQVDDNNMNDTSKKNVPCTGNPQGVTRLFVGNLSFTINETLLEEFFLPGKMTHLKWITDKETGKFYGSAFIEMFNSIDAAAAVTKAGQSLLGRPIKINYAPALPGDKWPPEKKVITGGAASTTTKISITATAGGVGIKAMSVKPENCSKLFIGNLSYEIDDDIITKFFASVDAEVKAVRWIHHKDSGDFKGVYVYSCTVHTCNQSCFFHIGLTYFFFTFQWFCGILEYRSM
jgi:RNA recognition motif-containing protein